MALSGANLTAVAPTTSQDYYFVYKLANECETVGTLTINLVSCCPTIDNPLGNQTICAGATASTLAAATNVTAAGGVIFKYFTTQQTEVSIVYGSGTTLTGGVNITNGAATYTPLSSDFNNTTASPITYYVYAVLSPTPAIMQRVTLVYKLVQILLLISMHYQVPYQMLHHTVSQT